MPYLSDFSTYQGVGVTGVKARQKMVDELNIKHLSVKGIMAKTPRHYFVDEALSHHAYDNISLPIGFSQTISQPQIVAQMTQALIGNDAKNSFETVLEVGTGCGYQTAILAQLFDTVYSIERIASLQLKAKSRLNTLGFNNIHCFHSDGSNLQKTQTFDAIILTAAPDIIAEHIINLLAVNGRLIAPEGGQNQSGQKLIEITFDGQQYHKQSIGVVDFVPLLDGLVS